MTERFERSWTGAFQSRVARRMVVLFVLCTLVPMAGLAVMTLNRTTRFLEREEGERLRAEAKAEMMAALGRLEQLDHTLRVLGATVATDRSGRAAGRIEDLFPRRPSVRTYIPDEGPSVQLGAEERLPVLSGEQRQWLNEGRAIIVQTRGTNEEGDLLVVPVDSRSGTGVMVATIDYMWVFGFDDPDSLAADVGFCVHRQNRAIACSPGVPLEAVHASARMGMNASTVLAAESEPLTARSRMVPLQIGYRTDPLTLVVMRPVSLGLLPAREFLRDFSWVTLSSLAAVSLLVLSQVARRMRPLASLVEATRRLASRQFGTPVRIVSGDEFEELGDAFNNLSSELMRQFDQLEAFSLGALEALARAIDAKSHWTSGHSNRVTELAVAIASEMKLPADEIEQLRRGGLVHDIGKLGTPAGILDKPGRLTDEEMAIMREHTTVGVHILEPLVGFGPLLPIVRHHHERWDGGGYPDGLAGEAIERTARVLAVADVFDALQSDRPYRAGMPLPEVVAIIRAGAGRHFDPMAVEAFLRLAGEQGERLDGAATSRAA